jgi:hypothetical protein
MTFVVGINNIFGAEKITNNYEFNYIYTDGFILFSVWAGRDEGQICA